MKGFGVYKENQRTWGEEREGRESIKGAGQEELSLGLSIKECRAFIGRFTIEICDGITW